MVFQLFQYALLLKLTEWFLSRRLKTIEIKITLSIANNISIKVRGIKLSKDYAENIVSIYVFFKRKNYENNLSLYVFKLLK